MAGKSLPFARLSSLGGSSVNRQSFQQAMEIYKLEHHGTSSCRRWPIYGWFTCIFLLRMVVFQFAMLNNQKLISNNSITWNLRRFWDDSPKKKNIMNQASGERREVVFFPPRKLDYRRVIEDGDIWALAEPRYRQKLLGINRYWDDESSHILFIGLV